MQEPVQPARAYNKGNESRLFELFMVLYRQQYGCAEQEEAFASEMLELIEPLSAESRSAIVSAWMTYVSAIAVTTFANSVMQKIYDSGIYHINLVMWGVCDEDAIHPFNRSIEVIDKHYFPHYVNTPQADGSRSDEE